VEKGRLQLLESMGLVALNFNSIPTAARGDVEAAEGPQEGLVEMNDVGGLRILRLSEALDLCAKTV
jgi:hypothetical protein